MASTRGIGRLAPMPELSNLALLVIGYAGRDQASVQHHIDELAAIGIAPPPHVPMVYELSPGLITYERIVRVPGTRTSGEVEPVLVRAGGVWHLALGSDHTDRDLEADDIKNSKAVCPKPVSRTAICLVCDPSIGGCDRGDELDRRRRVPAGHVGNPSGAERPDCAHDREPPLRLEYTVQVEPGTAGD